jgi:hypothetical protein
MSAETPTGNPPIRVEESKSIEPLTAEPTWRPASSGTLIEVSADAITESLIKMWGLELKGPGWIRETIEPSDLIKVLMYRPETKPYLSPRPEILVEYYQSELDRVLEVWYVIPDQSIKCWNTVGKLRPDGWQGTTKEIDWNDIDWNAFRIKER